MMMFDTISLDQLATFEMGQSPDSKFVVESDEGIPFLQGCAEFGTITPNFIVSCIRPKKICKPGDILISVRAPVGDLNKADREYCIGRGLAAIRFKNGIDTNFGWHLLSYWATSLRAVAQGSTFEAIGKQELANLQIADIPLPEQRRIAEILDTIDEAIQKTEALISKLKAMKQGLLHDLLTHGLDKNGKLRDPKAHPEQFKDSPLGKIPSGWKIHGLDTICQLSGGYGFPDSFQGSVGGELPFIKVSDMSLPGNERDIVNANNYVSMRTANSMGWKPFPTGAVVFAKVGAALKLNRRRILIKPTLIDNNMMAAIPQGGFNSAFLYHFLCVIDFGDFVQDGALPSVNQEQIGSIKIPDINKGEQRRIADTIDAHDALIRTEEQYRDKLKLQKKGLMHDLLTGRVRVKV
jgi:Restriction endonuclease S subunits